MPQLARTSAATGPAEVCPAVVSLASGVSSRRRSMTGNSPFIELQQISKVYRMGDVEVTALCDISLVISQGEFVAIMGASGSGKSTLMNILGCLDRPTSGRYLLAGRDVSQLSRGELAEIRNRLLGF